MCLALVGLGPAGPAVAAVAPQPVPGCTFTYSSTSDESTWTTPIWAYCSGITSLAPLADYPSLTALDVNFAHAAGPATAVSMFADATPLEKLVKLTRLYIGGVSDAGVVSIGKLTALQTLGMWGHFSEVSPLSGLAALTSLRVDSDTFTDARQLAQLSALKDLTFIGGPLIDLSPLAHMASLESAQIHSWPAVTTVKVRSGLPFALPAVIGLNGKVLAPASKSPELSIVSPGVAVTQSSGSMAVSWESSKIPVGLASSLASFSFAFNQGFNVQPRLSNLMVTRTAGPDRYSTAVAISRSAYAKTASVVYVAAGTNYPDALVAGPAAAVEGGPLLLTAPTVLPDSIRQELQRLHPARVVVGGPASVSATVLNQIRAMVPNTVRRDGADRYAVARAVAANTKWKSSTAYVASGQTYPDALSAAASAGSQGSPVILVTGLSSSSDQATRTLLATLVIQKTIIAGGRGSVSVGMEKSFSAFHPIRVGAADRYVVNRSLNAAITKSATTAYLAAGANLPDALAGSAIAGVQPAPLYLVARGCIPTGDLADMSASSINSLVILGGPASVSGTVEYLASCR